jgi:hypothetical protein
LAERDDILAALVKEVLGPRKGANEVLPRNQDPRDEYISGILAPARTLRPPDDIDADIEEIIEETSSDEDQDIQGFVSAAGVFSPALDPKSLPRSIGVSFTVASDVGVPQLEVCATWAQYEQVATGWQRKPAAIVKSPVRADRPSEWRTPPGILLQLRSRPLPGAAWRVSLFLVNEIPVSEPDLPGTHQHLFQPQIRVNCLSGTRIVPTATPLSSPMGPGALVEEDASLGLLYRDRTALARGHLCGVVWKAIDPERPHPTLPPPDTIPFIWADAELVPSEDRARFSPPDVRTDLIPLYPIPAPEMAWDARYGPPPVLAPDALAELWQPDQMRAALEPLVTGYQQWIREQQTQLDSPNDAGPPGGMQLTTDQQATAQSHLERCQQASSRLQEAIQILATDPDVRLAFCFANRAIALQARWARPDQPLTWRSFQLAFILLNIPALADPLHADRAICDLLWFPTGGGKTEAYLGLAAFTLALRRRRTYQQQQGTPGAGVGVLSRYTLRLLTIQQFRRALYNDPQNLDHGTASAKVEVPDDPDAQNLQRQLQS